MRYSMKLMWIWNWMCQSSLIKIPLIRLNANACSKHNIMFKLYGCTIEILRDDILNEIKMVDYLTYLQMRRGDWFMDVQLANHNINCIISINKYNCRRFLLVAHIAVLLQHKYIKKPSIAHAQDLLLLNIFTLNCIALTFFSKNKLHMYVLALYWAFIYSIYHQSNK